MFAALARFSFRHRWPVLIAFLVLFPTAAVIGGGVFNVLKPGGFEDPTSESFAANEQLMEELNAGGADLIALYTVPSGNVEDPRVRAGVTTALDRVAQDPGVERVTSFYAS
ncbi:MAG: MMPL family transporter, partial [Dehalococcoidia bacterium]